MTNRSDAPVNEGLGRRGGRLPWNVEVRHVGDIQYLAKTRSGHLPSHSWESDGGSAREVPIEILPSAAGRAGGRQKETAQTGDIPPCPCPGV